MFINDFIYPISIKIKKIFIYNNVSPINNTSWMTISCFWNISLNIWPEPFFCFCIKNIKCITAVFITTTSPQIYLSIQSNNSVTISLKWYLWYLLSSFYSVPSIWSCKMLLIRIQNTNQLTGIVNIIKTYMKEYTRPMQI